MYLVSQVVGLVMVFIPHKSTYADLIVLKLYDISFGLASGFLAGMWHVVVSRFLPCFSEVVAAIRVLLGWGRLGVLVGGLFGDV
jgi:hypothetical protein